MLTRTGHHLLHLLMEVAVLGLAALALLLCLLAWRLAQGPIDITGFVQRQEAKLAPPGGHLAIGHASLAWEGFRDQDSPVDLRLADVVLDVPRHGLAVRLGSARATLSFPLLLAGRVAPRTLAADSVSLSLNRQAPAVAAGGAAAAGPAQSGPLPEIAKLEAAPGARRTMPSPAAASVLPPEAQRALSALSREPGYAGSPVWLASLRHVALSHAVATITDPALGPALQVTGVAMDLRRPAAGGLSGSAHAVLQAGAASASFDLNAALRPGGTMVTIAVSPVSPAVVATLSPTLAGLAAVNMPVTLHAQADLTPALVLRQARLDATGGAGSLRHGEAAVGVASAEVHVSATPQAVRLEGLRLALAAPPGKQGPPVITISAEASRALGRMLTRFSVDIPSMNLADLGEYWPAGTGGDSRTWLVENIAAGMARGAHVEGRLESGADFSGATLTALSGGLTADDLSLYWLKPVPPLTHGHARVVIESPDALRVNVDSAEQSGVRLLAGSNIEVTRLEEKHQFGDITAHLAGPLDATLGILNHPRLRLLARGGFDFSGASGTVDAHLSVHIPLEAKVTMDDIRIASTATLAQVHLGHVAVGRDLNDAALQLKVDNDALQITGAGAFAGIPTSLVLGMDFTNGGETQVVQHISAHGTASAAQAKAAGLPDFAASMLTGGSVALGVDFSARRDRTSTVLLDADLSDAAVKTPLGWTKPAGASADAGARLSFSAGALTGIDHLHASGPGLAIASHAELQGTRTHALILDRLELGQTRAHGAIGLALRPGDPLTVSLSGPVLDLSGYLDQPQDTLARAVPAHEAKPAQAHGTPWSTDLKFDMLQLAKGHRLSPFTLTAASNGVHITHADVAAGRPGEIAARIAPAGDGRTLTVASDDAGTFLRGMGVADNLEGGHLALNGRFDDTRSGDPLTGTATLTRFTMRQAPAIGRLLQGMTLYGLTDVLRGPGLHFSEAVVPFTWRERVLTLRSARAFSPSLGFTAQGDIDLARRQADVRGTVVPAYFFNQLLGDLPVLGRLFSPEKGGGVFAARYSVTGPLANPKVGVNPLAALTPGFLREGFGLLPHAQAAGQ